MNILPSPDQNIPLVERAPLLVAEGISKSFPGVVALKNVNFEVRPGEVNALVGENGAGKSTIIKIMAGLHAPDGGTVRVADKPLQPTPSAAHEAGIATIHQDSHLVPSMSVAENIMLGHWPTRFGFVCRKAQAEKARAAIARVAPSLSPNKLAARLSPAEGQLVEIARAVSENSRILVMDEPTTSLSTREIDHLFRVVDELKAADIGIVFVSHWLEEVFRIADRITVLRDGSLVDSLPVSALDHDKVIRMMVGRGVSEVRAAARELGKPILEVRNLTRTGVVEDVSLTVRAGEIVSLSGMVGAGRTELANCIFGVDRYDRGDVRLDGLALAPGDTVAAIRSGVALVPEDRRQQALIGRLPVGANATLAVLDQISPFGVVSKTRELRALETATKSVAVKMASLNVPISTLSGGNQQKIVLGRWLARKPKLLILDEPTKGIDIGAKAEISKIILELAAQGTAILLISSELPEILALSDRVFVMRSGRVAGELHRDQISPEAIMNLATTG